MQRVTARGEMERDQGAVAVLFALSFVVLIGFVGLGIDVTSAYAKTQEVQNAADAAALAVAQECAGNGDDCGVDSSLPADLASRNIRSGFDEDEKAPIVDLSVEKRVTVTIQATDENYFVDIFGFDKFDVARTATAAWDSPTRITTYLPLTVGECEFNELLLESEQVVVVNLTKTSNANCTVDTSGNLMPGGFGYIGSGECETIVVDINEGDGWIKKRTGNNPPDCDVNELHSIVDNRTPVLVPIFDACRMKNPNAESEGRCLEAASTDIPKDAYHIVGFAAVELHGIKLGGGGTDFAYPQAGVDNINTFCPGNERCLRGRYVEWVELGDVAEWGEAPDFGVESVRLIDPEHETSSP